MLKKLVSLSMGVMIASVLALPAVAADGTPAAGTARQPSPCIQAVRQAAKDFHAAQVKLRADFRASRPHTQAERQAFREAHRTTLKTQHETQKAARAACKANK